MGGGKTRTEEVIEGGMVIEEAGSTIRAAPIGTTKEVLELVKGEVALKAETHLGWSLLSYEFSNRIYDSSPFVEAAIILPHLLFFTFILIPRGKFVN